MTTSIPPLTQLAVWQVLEAHYPKVRELHLRNLFADDRKRGEHMTIEADGIYFHYSKHRITDETLGLLMQLAEESGLRARIDAMFRGEKANITEKRAVLHVALRAPQRAIHCRGRTCTCLKQSEFAPVFVPARIAVLLALTAELFDCVPLDQMTDAEHALHEAAANIPMEVCAIRKRQKIERRGSYNDYRNRPPIAGSFPAQVRIPNRCQTQK